MSHRNDRRTNEKDGVPYYKQKHFIPNAYENRRSADPSRAHLEGPAYTIDAESLCMSDSLGGRPYANPITVTEVLVDKLSRNDFHLEYICRGCETWVPTRLERPTRPAAPDPVASCFGCWFGHLNGGPGEFVSTDKDEAFSAWAAARSEVTALEQRRSRATGAEKERLAKFIDKAHARVHHSASRCKRLGFNPHTAKLGQNEWVPPLCPQTREENRKWRERDELQAIKEEQRKDDRQTRKLSSAPSPNCGNCRNWEKDAALSGIGGAMGACWVSGNTTKGSTWCGDHNPKSE